MGNGDNPQEKPTPATTSLLFIFSPSELFRCVTGIPGKNQIIAVLNSHSKPPPRKELRSTLEMNTEELKVLFRGFLRVSRKRNDEVYLSEHHGVLRSKKEFHIHFSFSGSEFAEVYPQLQDRLRLRDMEAIRRTRLMEWAAEDLEKCIDELSKTNQGTKQITGPESDIVELFYHPVYARINLSTSCDFFGFSRSFSFVKEYVRYFDLKDFHLVISHNNIQIAMTCDEYVKHIIPIKGIEWAKTWVSAYERAFKEGDTGTVLDS